MEIIFATHNDNKVSEIQKLVPSHMKVLSLSDIKCDQDIPETAETLEGNASLKSAFVKTHFDLNCFADDTGLEIEALGGAPGVRSARYTNEHEKSDQANMAKVLKNLAGQSNRKAQFRTVISLRLNEKEYQFEGVCAGEITDKKAGSKGFGYDPIFKPEGYSVTFADMTMEEKNAISHRGQAVKKLVDFLNSVLE